MTDKITADHIALLQSMELYWDGSNNPGVPAFANKRPYGNSGVVVDVAEILEEPIADPDQGLTEEQWERMEAIHRGTEHALATLFAALSNERVLAVLREEGFVE